VPLPKFRYLSFLIKFLMNGKYGAMQLLGGGGFFTEGVA
jgi:hypothetical protein